VPEPSLAAEVLGPSPTAEAAEASSAVGVVTVEEMMELAMCRYIDFPGIGVIDLEAPQLPEKVLEMATERMFVEPSIMEMIASVSEVLHDYERAGGFAPATAAEMAEGAFEVPAVVWTSLGPLHRWVPGPTTRWASGTTRLVPHDT
jgi:hypothetical protein